MPIDWLLVGARWLHFAALAGVFGGALFRFLVAPRAGRDARGGQWFALAAWLALASGLAWAGASLTAMTQDARSLVDPGMLAAFFRDTGFGRVWMARLVLLLALPVVAARPGSPARDGWLAALAGGALAGQAWLGHAAMGEGGAAVPELASYMVHVLAASAWVGALVPLGVMLAKRRAPDPAGCHAALLRFSHAGMALVALILASGIVNAMFRLTSPRDLLRTPYGWALSCKIALFMIMLAVAAANRWRLMPRLAAGDARALPALRRNVAVEQAIGILVLGAAALLGTLPPQG